MRKLTAAALGCCLALSACGSASPSATKHEQAVIVAALRSYEHEVKRELENPNVLAFLNVGTAPKGISNAEWQAAIKHDRMLQELLGPGNPWMNSIPAKARAALLNLALGRAALQGDAHPDDIQAILTEKGPSLLRCPSASPCRLSQLRPTRGQKEYVVAMRGHFKPVCIGGPLPWACSGKKMSQLVSVVVLTASLSLEALTWQYREVYPELKAYGVPVALSSN